MQNRISETILAEFLGKAAIRAGARSAKISLPPVAAANAYLKKAKVRIA